MRGRGPVTIGALFAAQLVLTSTAVAASALPPVPAGWKIDSSAKGDLTGDGIEDVAVVIRGTDPRRVVQNDGLGQSELDENPRRLLVFEKTPAGFRQIATATRFIPPAGSRDSTCLEDPLAEGGISIKRQVLSVNLHYWLSCGSYGVTSNSYAFRREGGRFRLIGFDHLDFMRSSGLGEKVSVNLLTGRKGTSPFAIDDTVRERWRWTRVKPLRLFLEQMNLEACTAIDSKTSLC